MLRNSEDYVIAVPTTELIINKTGRTDAGLSLFKSDERELPIFGLFGKFNSQVTSDLNGYLKSEGTKKIMCTYDKVPRLLDFINPKDYRILIDEYENEATRKRLWESIYEEHLNELEMYVRKYDAGVIHEFDSLDDLRRFDVAYLDNSGSETLRTLCMKLGCRERDITQIVPVTGEARVFRFDCEGKEFIYNAVTRTFQGGLT